MNRSKDREGKRCMKKKNIIIISIIIFVIVIATIMGILIKKIQKEMREYKIEPISEYKYFVLKEENKYGVIDTKGNKIIENKYDDIKIPNPERDVFICYENENTKVLNEKSEEIYTQYDNIQPLRLKNISGDLMYEKSVLKYSENGKYGIIDFTGKELTKAIYEEIDTFQFKEGELLVKKEGKYGILKIKGTTLVKTEYDKIEADKFYESENGYKNAGYIVSKTTEEGYRYGYIDIEGKLIIKPQYNDIYRIVEIDEKEIYIIAAENGKYGLFKNTNKIIDNQYQSLIYNESNNTITALKGKKYGVLSIEGEIIVPFEYNQIDISGEYIYATKTDKDTEIFNSNGEKSNIDKNLAIINVENTDYKIYIQTIEGKTRYSIYKNNEIVTKNQYTYIKYLYDNYFIACNENGRLGIIDDKEKTKIEFYYHSIQQIENTKMIEAIRDKENKVQIYSKDMNMICELENAIIENNKEYIKVYNKNEIKYISKEEKEVDNKEVFSNNKIFAKKLNGLWGFVDKENKNIIDYKYEKVTEVNKYGFAGVKLDGKWGVINDKGQIIVEPKYELNENDPMFIGEYYQVIYGNGEIYYTK